MPIVPPVGRYALIAALLVPLALAACEDEGDLGEVGEEAGEAVENVGEETGEALEEAGEEAEERAD